MLRQLPLAILSLASLAMAQGWVDKTPTNPIQRPTNRAFPAMCWDAAHGYVLLWGGIGSLGGLLNDTWAWNGTTWTQFAVANPPPVSGQPPVAQTMAFHPPSNQVILQTAGYTHVWNGSNWFVQGAHIITGAGQPADVAMAYDPTRNQMVLFVGSRTGYPTNPTTPASETFLWNGFGWSQIPTATLPYPVGLPSLTFDASVNRLVLCTTGVGQSAFFEWNGTNWLQRIVAGAPTSSSALAPSNATGQLVVFDGDLNPQARHTWSLATAGITPLAVDPEPARRLGAGLVFDPVRGRTVLFGGTSYWPSPTSTFLFGLGDTWEFAMPTAASYTAFGSGCVGSHGTPALAASFAQAPRVGQPFQATVTGLPLTGLAFLFVGLSNTSYGPTPLPLSLGFLGAPGCTLYCSGDDLNLIPNVLGTGLWQWNVPNAPGAVFYNQAFAFDAAANALGITSSNGATGVIGF